MITIGIEGKPGSGKTSLSRYLQNTYNSIGYVNVDTIVRENGLIPKRDRVLNGLQRILRGIKKNSENFTSANEDQKLSRKLSLTQELEQGKQEFYSELIPLIESECRRFEKSGKTITIIDYALLSADKFWDTLDYRVLVTRDENNRVEAVKKRDGKNEREVDFISSFSQFEVGQSGKADTITINNDGDMESLFLKADTLLIQVLQSLRSKLDSQKQEASKIGEIEGLMEKLGITELQSSNCMEKI